MPIPGLTDRTPSFKEIGRLRKGAAKQPDNPKWRPSDLEYFRPDFRPDLGEAEKAAVERFLAAYGTKPTRIDVRLAFPEIVRCWDAFFMCYNTAGLLGQAGGINGREGLWWIYLRDNKTGAILVKDGEPHKEFDPSIPVYSYKNQKGVDVAVFAKPEGRLKLLVPEMKLANYMVLLTHSWYDISNISQELAAIDHLARMMNMTLPMVPLVLSRRKESISVSIDGKKRMDKRSLIHLDVSPVWAAAQFQVLDNLLPGGVRELPALPAGVHDEPEEDEEPEMYPIVGEPASLVGVPEPQAEMLDLFGSVPEPEPDPLEEAKAMTTPKGNKLENLEVEQLYAIMNSSKTPEGLRVAASLVAAWKVREQNGQPE
jgi:hypothetical protein